MVEEVKTQVPQTTNGKDDQGVNGFPLRNRILVLVAVPRLIAIEEAWRSKWKVVDMLTGIF